jgi:hypothetical protein
MRPISVGKNLTANTATTLYTVPTGYYAKCVLLHVTNSTASSKTINLSWYDTSLTTSFPIAADFSMASKANFDPFTDMQYFIMEEGDYITATSEAGATMSIVGTFEQIGLTRA